MYLQHYQFSPADGAAVIWNTKIYKKLVFFLIYNCISRKDLQVFHVPLCHLSCRVYRVCKEKTVGLWDFHSFSATTESIYFYGLNNDIISFCLFFCRVSEVLMVHLGLLVPEVLRDFQYVIYTVTVIHMTVSYNRVVISADRCLCSLLL